MRLFRQIKYCSSEKGFVATVGNYDGVHLGHQQILRRVVAQAKSLQLPSLVILFEPQPSEYFRKGCADSRLTTLREKLAILQTFGIENVLCQKFDAVFAKLSAQDFIENFLLAKLRVKHLIIGDDFAFGHDRLGNYVILQNYLRQGLQVELANPVHVDGIRVSSTRIRQALATGDLLNAKKFLGRPYTISGRVGYGNQLGRFLGFPTANIYLPHSNLPLTGVYLAKIYGIGDTPFPGIANIGTRPTVNGKHNLLEVHLLDFDQEIYGTRLTVEFLKKVRDEQKFANIELLKRQIGRDVEVGRFFFLMNK